MLWGGYATRTLACVNAIMIHHVQLGVEDYCHDFFHLILDFMMMVIYVEISMKNRNAGVCSASACVRVLSMTCY